MLCVAAAVVIDIVVATVVATTITDCKCFCTTDKVMAFDVHHAEELHHSEEEGASSVSTIVDATRALSVAAVGALLWLAL